MLWLSPMSLSLPRCIRSLFLKLGGEEVEYDPGFQLYLQTKLSNPHYKPEIAAQVRSTGTTISSRVSIGHTPAGSTHECRVDMVPAIVLRHIVA